MNLRIETLPKRRKSPPQRSKAKKRPRATKADVYRKWGIPEEMIRSGGLRSWFRYQNPIEKGIYWFFFSIKIRKRDVAKWGTCISCGRTITVDTSDCGHFIPAGSCGRDLLFDERNNNAECSHCNAWDEFHLIGYAKNLDKRYGEGTAQSLIDRYEVIKQQRKEGIIQKDFTRKEYQEKLMHLKNE